MSTVTMGNGQEGVKNNTLCGQPIEFTVTSRKWDGTVVSEGGHVFDVDIEHEDLGSIATMRLHRCDDGTYSFTHTPEQEGNYTLSVSLDDSRV